MKKKRLTKLILSEIIVGGMLALGIGCNAVQAATTYATTYDYVDGQWLQKEAAPTYMYTSHDKDITDWAVPVFDKNGKQVFELLYVPEDEQFLYHDYRSSYEMLRAAETGKETSPLLNQALVIGAKYWADVINTKNTLPLQLFIVSKGGYPNASASGWNCLGLGGKFEFSQESVLADVIQQNRKITHISNISDIKLQEIQAGEYSAFGHITIGDYPSSKEWNTNKGLYGMRIDVENLSHLPSSECGMDMIATLNHELTHALGMIFPGRIASDIGNKITDIAIEYEDAGKNRYNYIYKFNDQLNAWGAHLMDQNGNMAKASQYIAPSVKADSMIENSAGKLSKEDFFIIDNMDIYNDDVGEGGNKKAHADTPFAGKAFFVGDNVSQLLEGAEAFKTPVPRVYGVSVNTWEFDNEKYYNLELSHTSLPILMSHNMYRNYAINTELELAIMKDIGYDIDIRNQYGRSIYGDNLNIVNENGYFARNAQGTAYLENTYNNAYLGVGLHVFGSHNNITQKGNILTNGLGSIGVRVDGVGNTTTIAKGTQVSADGINGIGVLQSYGNSHELNVQGTVTATHATGNAVRFDFGGNMLGSVGEYRGSYLRYYRMFGLADGLLREGKNLAFDNILSYSDGKAEELNGPLVKNFNLSGSITGGKNAIYISKNAFVENINVLEGASITGNITSDWKDFAPKDDADKTNYGFNLGDKEEGYVALTRSSNGEEVANEAIMLQYQGEKYAYTSYIPDLVTNLNINADLAYKGDITGKENMRINLNNGTFAYDGKADVTKVTVGEDAVLQGGAFTLNNMSDKLAAGFGDDNTGTLLNEGMISAALPQGENTVLTINGNVKNDGGAFGFIASGDSVGRIVINGTLAECSDKILAVNPNGSYLPGDTFNVSGLVEVDGECVTFDDAVPYETSMLKAAYGDGYESISFAAENNLDSNDPAVNAAFDEMNNLAGAVSDGANEASKVVLGKLYGLDRANASKALKAIKGPQVANIPAVMQQNNLVRNTLGMRLNQVNRAKTVKVNVPVKQMTEGKALNTVMDITVQPQYDMWAKISRNKGAVNTASDYKTDAYSIGWDKQVSKDWRFGFFGSYAKGKFEADTIRNDLEDYRLGVYGGYNKDAAEAIVYADYGWGKNKLRRNLNFMNLATNSKYDSNIIELGAEYKYDLQGGRDKAWHVAPYGALQVNRYSQKAYAESGAEPFNKNVASQNNTYAGIEAGLDLERRFANGSAYGMRIGYRRGLTGVEPKQSYHYAADPLHRYTNYGEGDKNKLVLSINGELKTAHNWTLCGEAGYERGKKGHGYSGEISLKYSW